MRDTTGIGGATARWATRLAVGLCAALGALSWAPHLGEAADATVTGTGRFVFQKFVNGQWTEVGIKRARVEMCDDDQVLGCQLMAVGETDDDGYFSVTGRAGDFFGDLPDPLVKVIAQSPAATIEDTAILGSVFCFRSDARFDRPNGSQVDFGTISTTTGFGCTVGGDVDDQNDAWDLHNLAVEAWQFMREFTLVNPGRDVPPIKVKWPADRTAYDRPDFFSPNGTISIGNIVPRERFFMKQYGHHVLQQFADNPVGNFNNGLCDSDVDPFGVSTGRCYYRAENGAINWTEGFPIFLSEVLTRFWGYEGFGGYRIGPGPHPHPDTNFHLVPEVTATILWNLVGHATALSETVGMDVDGNNHDGNNSKDMVSVGFDAIWNAIMDFDPAPSDPAHNHPQTILEFWSAFAFLNPDLANRLSAVYDESHITGMLSANLEVTWVSGAPAVVAQGGTLTITDTTANTGYVSTGESSTTRFYLSTDTTITAADIQIGQRTVPSIAAGRADGGTTTVVIPASVPPGTYYIGACADAPGVIFESNESDNCMASGPTVRITEPVIAPSAPTDLAQLRTDGTTVLPVGAWTNQTSVVLRFAMADANHADSLVPEIEIKPVSTAFNGSGLRAGTAVASNGSPVQGSVVVPGLANGVSYHWRARVRDASGQVSAWSAFGGNAETARDVAVDSAAPTGSVVIDGNAAWSDALPVTLKLTCADAQSGCASVQLSNDNATFTAPEPFAATRPWTLAGSDATKTVYVRYIDRAGNVSKSFTDTIALDTHAPVVGAIVAAPSPFSPARNETTTIRIPISDNLSGSCPVQIRILDAAGGLVKGLAQTMPCSAAGTTTSIKWDGRNAAGQRVAAGTYAIEVAVTDRAGNAAALARGSVITQ